MTATFSPEQQAAIEHGSNPLLIIAGAGTGKTLVITHRIAHLIATHKARPHEILALTFTEKAASEMEERVDRLTPYGYTDVSILTFHAFGDRLLREFGLRIGLPPDFRVLSRPEQIVFFRKHLFDFPLTSYRPIGNPLKHIESLLAHISCLKDEAILPCDYQASADRLLEKALLHPEDLALMQEAQLHKELAATYEMNQRLMRENHYIDYGDQVALALHLLRSVPAVLQKLPYRYILIDEFQDTNPAQFQLIQALTQYGAAVTVVGDDDQSIYRFRGAAISNIQRFTTVYPDTTKIVLTQNFRSCQEILDAAYRLIQYNNPNRLEILEQVNKRLYAASKTLSDNTEYPVPVQHFYFDTVSAEADGVAKMILEGIAAGQRYHDFAILVRKNADAEIYLRTLNLFRIPNRFPGRSGLFNCPEIRLMIAFMRTVLDRDESASIYMLLSSALYRFSIDLLAQKMSFARRNNRSLYGVLQDNAVADPDPDRFSPFHKLKEDLDMALKRSLDVDAGVVLYEFIKKCGLLSGANDTVIQNIAQFFGEVKRICEWTATSRLPDVVESLGLLREAGEDPSTAEADFEEDAVSVLTVHRAKGLEFPTVFMVGLHDGGFPTRAKGKPLSIPSDLLTAETASSHTEEERRLFYVGATRAQKRLILTSAQYKASAGGQEQGRPRKISPFVMEALDLPRVAIRVIKASPQAAIEQAAGVLSSPLNEQHALGVGGVTSETARSLQQPGAAGTEKTAVKGPLSLTYYQIDDYLTCPLKYKYIHVLGIPIYPHHAIVYGNLMHQAIAAYLRARQQKLPFTSDAMLHFFEEGWKSEGYLSRAHEDQRRTAGRQALLRFYEKEEQQASAPTYIEKDFLFSFEGIKMKGRWDRIDCRGNGEDQEAIIIDYKTSEVLDQKTADKKAHESLQLTLYAWAYYERTSVLPHHVALHFIESGLVGKAIREHAEIDKFKETVRCVADGIGRKEFAARPTYMACRYCAYQDICPATASR